MFFVHVTRHDTLLKNITEGTLEGGRRRSGQRKNFLTKVKGWTVLPAQGLLTIAHNRQEWRVLSASKSIQSIPQWQVLVNWRLTYWRKHDAKNYGADGVRGTGNLPTARARPKTCVAADSELSRQLGPVVKTMGKASK